MKKFWIAFFVILLCFTTVSCAEENTIKMQEKNKLLIHSYTPVEWT